MNSQLGSEAIFVHKDTDRLYYRCGICTNTTDADHVQLMVLYCPVRDPTELYVIWSVQFDDEFMPLERWPQSQLGDSNE